MVGQLGFQQGQGGHAGGRGFYDEQNFATGGQGGYSQGVFGQQQGGQQDFSGQFHQGNSGFSLHNSSAGFGEVRG
jgi:hypothetical protein